MSGGDFKDFNRRRAEKVSQKQQTSNTTSFSDLLAQQTLMNLVEAFRKGDQVDWPQDFASVVFNAVWWRHFVTFVFCVVLEMRIQLLLLSWRNFRCLW